MAISFDTSSKNSNTTSFTYTPGTLTNGAIVVTLYCNTVGATCSAISYGGHAMSMVAHNYGDLYPFIFILTNPPAGAQTVSLTLSSGNANVATASYNGVNQSFPIDGVNVFIGGTGQTSPLTISVNVSQANSWLIAASNESNFLPTAGTGTTLRQTDPALIDSNGGVSTGSQSLQYQWTGGSQKFLAVMFSMAPAAGQSQQTTAYTSSGTNTYTPPAGTTSIQVYLWGGGGGDGRDANGAGAGAFAQYFTTSNLGSQTVIVGQGGRAGTTSTGGAGGTGFATGGSGGSGGPLGQGGGGGGSSAYGSLAIAAGGGGGSDNATAAISAGSTTGAAGSPGSVNRSAGGGGAAFTNGGDGSGTTAGAGGTGATAATGSGGAGNGSGGGSAAGLSGNGNNSPGSGNGGAGSGGAAGGTGGAANGSGANGSADGGSWPYNSGGGAGFSSGGGTPPAGGIPGGGASHIAAGNGANGGDGTVIVVATYVPVSNNAFLAFM